MKKDFFSVARVEKKEDCLQVISKELRGFTCRGAMTSEVARLRKRSHNLGFSGNRQRSSKV
jgi:hypothetical protein